MPRPKKPVPSYRLHKQSGQAIVTLSLAGGGRRDVLLGPYDSPESKEEYARVLRLWDAGGKTLPASAAGPDLTVNEALVRYTRFIDAHYRDADGNPTGTADDVRPTLGYLARLFGPTLLVEFTPSRLKAVRQAMVDDGRVRVQVNKRVSHVRQFVKWCVEEELVPPAVLEGLRAVRPLASGRSGVTEGKRVVPADPAAVAKALPFMPPAVRAVARLLWLSGARPGELLGMRPADLDRSGAVWVFAPSRHKGTWRGKARAIHFGPEAQGVLAPWLEGVGPADLVFTPARSELIRNAARAVARRTPRRASAEKDARTVSKAPRVLAVRYTRRTLGQAVARACQRAGVVPFTAYQLRHLKAVELRERFGLEYVRAVLGHSYKAMSDHYSQAADAELATRAAVACG